jgi:hypothetical protein
MISDNQRSGRIKFRAILALLAVAAVLSGSVYLYLEYLTPQKLVVRHRLSEADSRSKQAIDQRLKPLADLFERGRKGSKAFAEDALSLDSKWALVKSIVPGESSHNSYLSRAFERHVFSSVELRDAMQSEVKAYLDDVEGYEAEMLVKLRADLADPARPDPLLPARLVSDQEFQREYRKLSGLLVNELRLDMGVTVGRELGVFIATDIATQAAMQAARAAATQLGVNTGVLSGGAASTVATLGLGMIVAFIIDYILDEILKMAGHDPVAKIEALVRESIDKMEAALIQDSGMFWLNKKGSLRERMEQLHETRSTLRRETINRLLKEEGK